MLVFLAVWPALAEDGRLPYDEIYRLQKAQLELSRAHTNLALVLQMSSTLPDVKYSDIKASIDSKTGSIPVTIGPGGAFALPMRDDLFAENPWILVNQPKGTMQLSWHAGLAPAVARQLTNEVHYAPIMRAALECDEVQESMRQFFPTAPRLSAVGLRLTFRATSRGGGAIIYAKTGERRLPADAFGQLLIPVDADLLEENPMMRLSESPVAVEIVTEKSKGP